MVNLNKAIFRILVILLDIFEHVHLVEQRNVSTLFVYDMYTFCIHHVSIMNTFCTVLENNLFQEFILYFTTAEF